ncbi:dipeptidase PepV [Cytobacillus kochii]|uniref:dipeptidase PepV n=1 Tax=Cytobacillus kochii TaxID=859143 RepID=UPI00203DE7E0|nr:dipeptidase PepV [Cytobacillus kochii]MCM3322990.1 dipeptidase PepV [Cytobacillus kochii]MCM3345386.1 dipeptidase PepV [Cytobacillus kochii]
MGDINWQEEVMKRKDDLIKDTQKLLQIKSVLDEENATSDAPLGKEVKEALTYLLNLGETDGFIAKNVENLAGHLEFGQGEELLGILCHVDVVPEGDGWSSDPYAAEIRDGKIFARGAIDDKGPTMAAYYAMKIVKELGLDMNKRVRMIIGTDEESEWRCVDRYFEVEEMPTLGFAPDADFPIIYAEKGIADFDLVQKEIIRGVASSQVKVLSLQSGKRYNMVPDFAKASLMVQYEPTEVVQMYVDFLKEKELQGKYYMDNGELILELEGVSAHGMEPNLGKNAGLLLADFLSSLKLDQQADQFIGFIAKHFANDSRGNQLGIAFSDDITGDLTINVGKIYYKQQTGGRLGLNMRYPVTTDIESTLKKIEQKAQTLGMLFENLDDSRPHHVDGDSFLIQTLKKVYTEQTGEEAELLSIGGGTYARSLKAGVAFGALFPGREDVAHQKDEYMYIEDLLKATAIYAEAIYELTK